MPQLEDIKSISIGFENCISSQDLTFDQGAGSDVARLFIGGIHTNIYLNAGRILENKSCDRVYIILNKKCNVHFNEFWAESEDTLFDRILKYPDITDVGFKYENGDSECISVPWGGEQLECSSYQHTIIDSNGNLHIMIEKDFQGFPEDWIEPSKKEVN